MSSKLYAICLLCLALLLGACGGNGTSISSLGSGGEVEEGILPNGSNVIISASNFNLNINESSSADGILSITGGSANLSYTFIFGNSLVASNNTQNKAKANFTDNNGISITTNPLPCTLGTEGTGLLSSCSFSISASPMTAAGKYTVPLSAIGSDGSTTTLTPITIIVNGSTLSDAKAITAFSIDNVNATITEKNIALTLPYATNPAALVATFITTGSSVTVNDVVQDDGVTANDFTSPVNYVVHAADGTSATYTVTVTIAPQAGAITITTPGFASGGSVIQGNAFQVVATLTGSNISAQTITASDLSSDGISVTSSPSTCTLSTPSNLSCTFTIYAGWNLATAGNYTLQLSNSGNITPDQTSIGFSVYSPAVYLPQTGESAIFGWPSYTAASGADGNPAIGLTWPSTRFVIGSGAESGCITDILTGLMWTKNAFPQGTTPTWTGALTYTASLTLCGHSDWRLPNINELQSLVNDGYTGNNSASTTPRDWLQSQGFMNVRINYWSSSAYASSTNNIWYFSMSDGNAGPVARGTTTNGPAVWPVRNGAYSTTTTVTVAQIPQTGESATFGYPALTVPAGADGNPAVGKAWPNPRFESYPTSSSESACITDKLTGLMWTKNAYPQGSKPSWSDALAYITTFNTTNVCGYNDWRLPNKSELMSLVNFGYTGTNQATTTQINWLQSQGFSNVQSYYWSSSTNARDTTYAWMIIMDDGSITLDDKSSTSFSAVWPVRGGQ